ncbi:hypothetical protein KV557_12925 [Kitasatospora aureofaciens]|uniref:DUF7158 domain-containing protein n=1 Tax=Kitasatospora aureofaciens TaxID=1894 RepID=UPI001C48E9F9|nr:hypothetical protein [Kitasatospora aureofaciens]MBV6698025.1 hypothetical protein [Kitasatospora aureofaciens]
MTATLGLLDGRPLPRTPLDHRLAALRTGPRSTALPQPGSSEDRQLSRWVAQVLLTEALCEAVAAERNLPVGAEAPARLDQQAAVELGSITAAAYEGSPAVRAVYESVTAEIEASPEEVAHYRTMTTRPPAVVWQLALPDGECEATPDTLPQALAGALRQAGPGEWVTAGAWTAALLSERTITADHDITPDIRDATRRATFVRWLDRERAHRLTLVEGLEHPGDPAQPDNHHRH